jgi:hypothetical protein
MEGTPGDTVTSSEKKGESKDDKKTEKAFGLGKGTFEITNKKDKAEKIADAPWWEKLIPKESPDKPRAEASSDKADESPETASTETAEELDDPTIENLSENEKAEVIKDYAQEKVAELEAGRSEDEDPAEAAAREANIDFLHNLDETTEVERVEPIEVVPEAALETAEQQAIETEPAEPDEGPTEFEHGQEIPLNPPEQPTEVVDDSEDEEPAQHTVVTSSPPPVAPATQSNPNVAANQPPVQPTGPQTAPGAFGGTGAPSGPNLAGSSFNVPGPNPNAAPVTIENNYYEDNVGGALLAGAILGYMLGRRRGRIKTEKKLRAVSQKLENQINDVRQNVSRQEAAVRQEARARYNESHQPRVSETMPARTVETLRTETVTKLTGAEIAANKRRAAERLGITETTAAFTAERVPHMDHREVLDIAEKVDVNGTSLRTIYESKHITEPGLRRLTQEFLRGGDVASALKHETQVKEMQYERDPQMRDRLAASYAGVEAAQPQGSQEAMAQLLSQGVVPKQTPLRNSPEQAHEESKVAQERSKKAFISAWIVLMVVLVIIAFILAIR